MAADDNLELRIAELTHELEKEKRACSLRVRQLEETIKGMEYKLNLLRGSLGRADRWATRIQQIAKDGVGKWWTSNESYGRELNGCNLAKEHGTNII